MKRTKRMKPSMLKKTVAAVSAAAMLGAGVIGTGFVSPAMAAALQNLPVVGSIFDNVDQDNLQAAIDQGIAATPNLSVTHDGVTLKLTELLYDGSRLSFFIEREGVELENTLVPWKGDNGVKGYLEHPKALADGQAIPFSEGSISEVPGAPDSFQVEYTKGISLPEAFELTVQAKVTGVDEIYEYNIPVSINNSALVLTPDVTKSSGGFSYTVEQLELSPVTTRLILDSTGKAPASPEQAGQFHASMVYYDLFDDQGNLLEQKRVGFFNEIPGTAYHVNELYAPVSEAVSSITIKPYTFTVNGSDWSIQGAADGTLGTKTYLPELEVTIPVQR
ncbi:DUF4179 domain-containing protein [Paenibacillus tepidiphilus]|uniref:DUF4179 domain-containing protein n=1 Tax=Paenibacillus tepidiphilus TaxID=2608683 RepID=UPI001EF080F0|nr:DUF4179 domain-containing protein [Paenibacillus tepidiphilus]